MDKQMQTDLLQLHCMALSNTPTDPVERAKVMREYSAHKAKCIDEYGWDVTFNAEFYGVPAGDKP